MPCDASGSGEFIYLSSEGDCPHLDLLFFFQFACVQLEKDVVLV